MIFKQSKWIWSKTNYEADDYAEFVSSFSLEKKDDVYLRIACDSIYAVYLNDTLIAFAQCADYPNFKFYDEINLSPLVKIGDNKLKIQVYHMGKDSQIYIKDKAGLIFEIVQSTNVILSSNPDISSRIMNEYRNNYRKPLTRQIGYSFYFDSSVTPNPYVPSIVVDKTNCFYHRKIKTLTLKERRLFSIIKRDNSLIIDLGRETAGFIDLDIVSDDNQLLTVAYGEHLKDGGVRRIIGDLDFSFEIYLKKGQTIYLNPFRRIAGRYLELFFEKPIKINYIGIRPVFYPVEVKKVKFDDPLLQRIYDVSVDTLRLCMHEHYEDCPWREQALYTLDSRNQMLYGYYAFNEYKYARHNLIEIAHSQQPSGLLSICAPSGADIPIPFFSLVYIVQVYEYLKYSNDYSLLDEVGNVLDRIVKTFTDKIDSTGLIPSFPYPCWNYYEWSEGSDNGYQLNVKSNDEYIQSYDLILNAFYVYAVNLYQEMRKVKIDLNPIKAQIDKTFKRNGVYVLSTINNQASQFGNAIALLAGLGDDSLIDKIANDKNMIPATLSTLPFVYDVLLKDKKYVDYIIDDIKSKYKVMLDAGATSFWETTVGEDDFGGAGSLCHGWSSMPVYYFHLFGLTKTDK